MMDIERISEKIIEEKDNLIAKAFTCQIGNLLSKNGIVPIMTEHRREDLDLITDTDSYKLVYELGVTFDSLDTSEHDKQIRADVLEKIYKMMLLGCDELECEECFYKQYSQEVCQQAFTIEMIEKYIEEQSKEQNK